MLVAWSTLSTLSQQSGKWTKLLEMGILKPSLSVKCHNFSSFGRSTVIYLNLQKDVCLRQNKPSKSLAETRIESLLSPIRWGPWCENGDGSLVVSPGHCQGARMPPD